MLIHFQDAGSLDSQRLKGLTLVLFVVQLLLIDKHHLHVWDLVRDRFVARKRISQQPLFAIFKTHSKGEFGVVSGCAVDMWRIEQDLNYRIVLGGHTGPVVAVHPVNGAVVSLKRNRLNS